ncbi:MAG: hypothetical protein HYU88_01060 [Chloroflexi bacterium]|nr:hypothetical protein [Chloroflexota bacterium]
MKLRFEPRLMREWVLHEARRHPVFRERCRARLEPVYELSEEERAERFAAAYAELFAERALGHGVAAILDELPELRGRIREVVVCEALGGREEEVALSADRARIGVRLRLQRLVDGQEAAPWLRHELLRVADFLDEAFGYEADSASRTPGEEHAVRERYRLLWDIAIDGRLARAGRAPAHTREERQRTVERAFSFLALEERRAVFEALWEGTPASHARFLRWAQDPATLVADLGGQAASRPSAAAPIPGSLCPLCRFPTYAWAEPSAAARALIRDEFPSWTPDEGICERCCACYRVLAASGAVAP